MQPRFSYVLNATRVNNSAAMFSSYRLQILSYLKNELSKAQQLRNHFYHVMLAEVMRLVETMNEESCKLVVEVRVVQLDFFPGYSCMT